MPRSTGARVAANSVGAAMRTATGGGNAFIIIPAVWTTRVQCETTRTGIVQGGRGNGGRYNEIEFCLTGAVVEKHEETIYCSMH